MKPYWLRDTGLATLQPKRRSQAMMRRTHGLVILDMK
jgi:hypothetical protein